MFIHIFPNLFNPSQMPFFWEKTDLQYIKIKSKNNLMIFRVIFNNTEEVAS